MNAAPELGIGTIVILIHVTSNREKNSVGQLHPSPHLKKPDFQTAA